MRYITGQAIGSLNLKSHARCTPVCGDAVGIDVRK